MGVDLKKEQLASHERPRYKYSFIARCFFASMDLVAGKTLTLAKAKLIEILASIPYRAWEIRQYARMTKHYRKGDLVRRANVIMNYGRHSQDNEYQHLLVLNEKMKEDGLKDPWYLYQPMPCIMVLCYVIMTRLMAVFCIRRAFLFNAEFEDHAEHEYARVVGEHPEWEKQPVHNDVVKAYSDQATWADVMRRIGLDERDHMNASFALCGMDEHIVRYEGMPELPCLDGPRRES